MKPHINFLIRCGIVAVLILAFFIISSNTEPAEIPGHTEPSRIAPTEASEPAKIKACTDMPSTENEPHAAPERKPEPDMNPPE